VAQLRRDIYFEGGVWDWERVVIYPVSVFCALFRGSGDGDAGKGGKREGGSMDGWGWAGLMGGDSSRVRFGRSCEGFGGVVCIYGRGMCMGWAQGA